MTNKEERSSRGHKERLRYLLLAGRKLKKPRDFRRPRGGTKEKKKEYCNS